MGQITSNFMLIYFAAADQNLVGKISPMLLLGWTAYVRNNFKEEGLLAGSMAFAVCMAANYW